MAPCWRRDEPGLFAHTALATPELSFCSCTFVGLMYRRMWSLRIGPTWPYGLSKGDEQAGPSNNQYDARVAPSLASFNLRNLPSMQVCSYRPRTS
jgi:hypothetical protein